MHSVLKEKAILNEGSEDELECYGYRRSIPKTVLCCIVGILTCGLLLIFLRWKPNWKVNALYVRCNLNDAECILIRDYYKRWHTTLVKTEEVEIPSEKDRHAEFTSGINGGPGHMMPTMDTIRYFMFQKMKYLWDFNRNTFHKLRGLDYNVPLRDFHTKYVGLDAKEQSRRRDMYGWNVIQIGLRSIPVLFFEEALNPFYVFQVYSVCLWIFGYAYIYFSVAIIFMSLISITLTVYSTRQQSKALRAMVASSSYVTVCRGGDVYREMDEKDLVPGDLIELPRQGCFMSCDAVLISGNCIVNESMLTGESTPITKTPLPNKAPEDDAAPEFYDTEKHKRHTLFCGTHIMQSRRIGKKKVMAVVVNTGFSTAKGALVHSILYPKPMNLKLHRDAIRFVAVLACFAFVGAIYIITIKIINGADTKDIILKAMDIFTVAVSPALPAALTIGLVYAQKRLKDLGIFCISPQRINLGGMMDVVCFDKTGTLTQDHLELLAVSPVKTDSFVIVEDASKMPFGPFVAGMATCHSLTVIEDQIRGDPLDVQMFQAIKWSIREPLDVEPVFGFNHFMPTIVRSPSFGSDTPVEEMGRSSTFDSGAGTPVTNNKDALGRSSTFGSQPGPGSNTPNDEVNPYEIGIIRQFPFSSNLQRMSVITQTKDTKHMEVYVKGAPETIARLCDQSTVPLEFHEILKEHTQNGLRVLAMAWKPLHASFSYENAEKIDREEVEQDLQMLGLLILQNTIKPETNAVIAQLRDARIRTVMVTGDNKLTAIHVARACGMIGQSQQVVEVEATPPEGDQGPLISWKPVQKPGDNSKTSTPMHHKMNGQVEEDDVALTIEEGEEISNEVLSSTYHLALDGKTFAVLMEHVPHLVPKIAAKGTVFARMSPDQKAQLVEALQALEYYVGMCGDGANDCGALKTAHAGVSLSEAEASVASPFTSSEQNIKCIPTLIKEGRAALVTSFGVFKYMALYSMIQFATIIILNTIELFPSDGMFMYWDIAITAVVAILIARNKAYTKISTRKPLNSLTDPAMLFSIFIHIFLQFMVQIIAYFVLKQQPWFVPYRKSEDAGLVYTLAYESTTLFFVSNFQYLIVAFIFSKGPPFRRPIYTNYLFSGSLIIICGFSLFLVLCPIDKIYQYFHLKTVDWLFRCIIIALVLAHFLAAVLIENFLADTRFIQNYATCRKWRKGKKVVKHEILIEQLNSDPTWPPINSTTSANRINGHSAKETDV
ncbi:probable cation-transporting ATPase 13A3 [Lytechinus variegatus]|uniref:probable cation-transporting ATPase 13A3 n=1 Tax=Lytechinus variegatus TaxID=7654 RepID=UPI001BB1B41F|nr:probable cation-transporting ATPase 13A3 [Lytechinus variegatus]